MDKSKNTCTICKVKAYIQCDECQHPVFFCSRGHLHSHKIKIHKNDKYTSNQNSHTVSISKNESHISSKQTKTQLVEKEAEIDLRKLFEHLQLLKNDIEIKIRNKNYIEAILSINKCLNLGAKFYKDDHLFVNFKK
jgi:hypothetical protein